jgi:predicted glutamine amidotransferase
LGHLRAPTGNSRNFDLINSHPFEYEDWLVAHNGIITNFDKINHWNFKVDSNVIPYFLSLRGFDAFNLFEGTWACWMYNKKEKQLYVTRSDNTLFYNPSNGHFSSKNPENNFYALEQKKVFKIHASSNYYEPVFEYKPKTLYFTP